ncbi:MAG: tetratricopeptide repeat protein, partial [Planctomycetota bacterium]
MRTLFLLFFAGNWLGWGAIGFAQSPTFAFRQASEAYQARDWAEAARQFSSLISNQPGGAESREAWFYLGEARTQLGESEAATAAYRNFLLLVGSHPHREKARFRLAEQAYLSGSADSVQQCEGFLQAYPRSVWQAEMLAYLGQLRLQRGEAQLAAEVLGTALKRFPEHPLADENRLGLASAQFKLGDGDSADKLLKDLEQRRNDGVGQRARLLLALRELEAGDRTAARKRLESVLASNAVDARQIAESRFWLARILVQEGDSATAATLYWQALESGLGIPQFTIAIREWTSLRLQMGEANEAASDLKKLQQASEAQNWTRSHRELVLALEVRFAFEAGQWDEAAQGAETYRVSFPTGHDYRQVTEIAGRAAYAQGKYESAAEMFAELLRTPDLEVRERATYQYQLACQQVASKQFAAALATLAELDARLLAAEGAWHAKRLEAVALEGEGRARESMECLRELSTRVAPGGDEAQRYLLRQALQLAIKLEQLDAVAAFWPGFRALGSLTSADLSLVQRVGDLAYRNRDWAWATDCYRDRARSDW